MAYMVKSVSVRLRVIAAKTLRRLWHLWREREKGMAESYIPVGDPVGDEAPQALSEKTIRPANVSVWASAVRMSSSKKQQHNKDEFSKK